MNFYDCKREVEAIRHDETNALPSKHKNYRELWALTGPGWVLPLGVEWGESRDLARVRIGGGMHVLESWRKEVKPMLDRIAMSHTENCWMILRPALEVLATPTLETDPEELVDWRPRSRRINLGGPRMRTDAPTERKNDRRKFWEGFIAETSLPFMRTPEQAELFLHLLHTYMMHWLLNEQKPVDLIFCRIFPTIFPAESIHKAASSVRQARTIEGVLKRSYGLHVESKASYDSQHRALLWRLEVRPEMSWWRAALKVERVRRRTLGRDKYDRYIKQTIHDLIPQTHDLVDSLRAQRIRQIRIDGIGSAQGGLSSMAYIGELVTLRSDNGVVLRSYWRPRVRQPKTLVEKVESLSALSGLQPVGTYVRHGGRLYYRYQLGHYT